MTLRPKFRPRWPQKVRNTATCSIEECERPMQARGWCNIHYHRHRKYGSTDDPWAFRPRCTAEGCDRPANGRRSELCPAHSSQKRRASAESRAKVDRPPLAACSVDGCNQTGSRRDGLCRSHQRRAKLYGSPEGAGRKDRTVDLEIRFEKLTRWGEPPSHRPNLGPCRIYLGADNGNGYGQFRWNGRNGYAHRYAWERERGAIPHGLTIDHLCRVRSCVNIEHLEVVDGPTNTRRAAAVRTHCKNGHEFTPENTKMRRGVRECRICDAASRKRSDFKRTLAYLGRPSKTIKYNQQTVAVVIGEIRRAELTIAQGARRIGCHPNYLGRRVWQECKRDVIARDGKCVLCGSTDMLDVHHRRARKSGGSYDPAIAFGMANLVTLCRTHHDQTEQNPDWARSKGLRLDNGQVPAERPVLLPEGWRLLTDHGIKWPAVAPEGGVA